MRLLKFMSVAAIIIACIFCLVSFLKPIRYSNSCGEDNLYRYRMGIYQIQTNTLKEKELQKLGGLLSFTGIQNIRCLNELERQRYKMLAQAIDSTNRSLKWRLVKDDLWINKKGDIGLKEVIVIGSEGFTFVDSYLTRMGFNTEEPLNTIIDTSTFQKLNSAFYKDKKHIYRHYAMAYGGSFSTFEEADHATFVALSDCYAKDKNHIYENREGILKNVDYKTFKVKSTVSGCFAKDKNGYLSWSDRITGDGLNDEYVKKAISELDK
ncbi:hypothetical protein DCO56_10100 [Sphingobacterium athyrii]|uniref:Lipoprotein n=2 Tax=Sphingobacterium athyrii TaxID=2152717 RepID=A0A363NX79_9SPHI|nr:hypothetical protein DCO56_10100 [Sphingobacterium athyrii]